MPEISKFFDFHFSGLEMYSLHIRKNRKIALYHDTAMEVDTGLIY